MKNKDIKYRQGRSKKQVKNNEQITVLSFIIFSAVILLGLIIEGIKQFI